LQAVPVSDAEATGSLQDQAGLSEVLLLPGLVPPSTQLFDSTEEKKKLRQKLAPYNSSKITIRTRTVSPQHNLSGDRT
jgi:hypothetical protein